MEKGKRPITFHMSIGYSFHLEDGPANTMTIDSQRVPNSILLSNINGNNRAIVHMMLEAYLFAWQYWGDVWNTMLHHSDIPCDVTGSSSEK